MFLTKIRAKSLAYHSRSKDVLYEEIQFFFLSLKTLREQSGSFGEKIKRTKKKQDSKWLNTL